MQLHPSVDTTTDAAALLTRDLPRDQALGLRLLAMARAAAAMHMGQAVLEGGADSGDDAQDGERMRQLLRSQAAGLVGMRQRVEAGQAPHLVRGS
ncbi:MAG TPA: hypothetical protein PKE29_04820 [Phycisphaerales bacterium]|nr:hypothetical protein [Phycisphaerales bacterium]